MKRTLHTLPADQIKILEETTAAQAAGGVTEPFPWGIIIDPIDKIDLGGIGGLGGGGFPYGIPSNGPFKGGY